MKKMGLVSVLVVALLVMVTFPAVMQDGGGSMSTAFAVQNLGEEEANIEASFYNTTGENTANLPQTVPAGANFNFDQRYDSGDPGADTFQGAAIVSADQPIGAAANMVRTGGPAPAYESYNALDMEAVGKSLLLPQILKDVASGGLSYNTTIVIQNTDTENQASVQVVFTPDPDINPVVGGTLEQPYTHTLNIPGGGSAYIDQATDPSGIGDKFFGSARVLSDIDVAVVVYNDGGGQILFALPAYAEGSTDPIYLPSVYKEIVSLGDSYSTAFLIVNFGDVDAEVEIEYLPIVGEAATQKDVVTVKAGGSLNVDQRYVDGITSDTFFGAAAIKSTNNQPIAAMVNLRGGTRYGMTYGGLMAGTTSAGYIPISYKEVASGGYSWSSTVVVQNMGGADAQVEFTFYPAGEAEIADVETYTVTAAEGVRQFDLRYTTAIGADGVNEQPRFIGALKVDVVSGTAGVMVQTRGAGGAGDSLMAFQALMP
jgi:hypothetical protein